MLLFFIQQYITIYFGFVLLTQKNEGNLGLGLVSNNPITTCSISEAKLTSGRGLVTQPVHVNATLC